MLRAQVPRSSDCLFYRSRRHRTWVTSPISGWLPCAAQTLAQLRVIETGIGLQQFSLPSEYRGEGISPLVARLEDRDRHWPGAAPPVITPGCATPGGGEGSSVPDRRLALPGSASQPDQADASARQRHRRGEGSRRGDCFTPILRASGPMGSTVELSEKEIRDPDQPVAYVNYAPSG